MNATNDYNNKQPSAEARKQLRLIAEYDRKRVFQAAQRIAAGHVFINVRLSDLLQAMKELKVRASAPEVAISLPAWGTTHQNFRARFAVGRVVGFIPAAPVANLR